MPVNDVHELKYGDCKALSFYTQALLDLYGIQSDYVVVEAGDSHKISFLNDFHSFGTGKSYNYQSPDGQ